jgi:hypothetical protein
MVADDPASAMTPFDHNTPHPDLLKRHGGFVTGIGKL